MAGYNDLTLSYSNNDFRCIDIDVVIENRKTGYTLHRLSLQRYHDGPQVVRKLLGLALQTGQLSILNFRTWTSQPVIHIARLQSSRLTQYMEAYSAYPTPVDVTNSRKSSYLTQGLQNPDIFPSAIELQRYLSGVLQVPARPRRRSSTNLRTSRAIMISYEISKAAVLLFCFTILTVAIIIGVIIGVLSRKSEVGIAVTGALVAIMAVVQSIYR